MNGYSVKYIPNGVTMHESGLNRGIFTLLLRMQDKLNDEMTDSDSLPYFTFICTSLCSVFLLFRFFSFLFGYAAGFQDLNSLTRD